jgi:hypothetical protein
LRSEKIYCSPFTGPHSNSGGGQHLFVSLKLFHFLLKDVRQRKSSFYGGRVKYFVNASAEKKWGIIRGKNFNKHCKN